MAGVLTNRKKKKKETETHTGKMPHEDEVRDQSNASTSQKWPAKLHKPG